MSKVGIIIGVLISEDNCKGCKEITHVKCLAHFLTHECFINVIYIVTVAILLINGDTTRLNNFTPDTFS